MRISVIIPTHNRADRVIDAIDSVLAQTRPADQIVVVDDHSSDNTPEVLEAYRGKILLTQAPRKGVSAARNHGVQQASGDWIAFLDDDDTWAANKLQVQAEALRREPHELCHTNEIWIRRGKRVNQMNKHQKFGGMIYLKCLPLCAISPSSVLLSRQLFETVGGFDEDLPACEDYDLWLRICIDHPVLFIDEPLVTKYGGHADQLSRAHWGMDRFRIRALEKILAHPKCIEDDRRQTLEVLRKKIEIMRAGAEKRGKQARVEQYQAMLLRYGG